MPSTGETDVLRALRAELGRIAGGDSAVWVDTGIPVLDQALGGRGLRRRCVHEMAGFSASAFLLALARRGCGGLLWCAPAGQGASLYPPGLAQAGPAPERLVLVTWLDRREALWAGEEALKCGAFALVVVELHAGVRLGEGRRLALAAEAGGSTGVLLLPRCGGLREASAAWTRWRVSPRPSPAPAERPRWRLRLARNRGGGTGQWEVEWDAQANRLSLVSAADDRPAPAPAPARLAG